MLAPSMAGVVRHAGGWLFDRVMAGWDVTVLTPASLDCRPLRILGVRSGDLESELSAVAADVELRAIAVDASLYDTDEQVRRMVLDVIDDNSAEVRLWDSRCPVESGVAAVEHRLSVAARAFKAQALAAAEAPVDSISSTELFTTGKPDLIPAA